MYYEFDVSGAECKLIELHLIGQSGQYRDIA